jgi:hypothetical protein
MKVKLAAHQSLLNISQRKKQNKGRPKGQLKSDIGAIRRWASFQGNRSNVPHLTKGKC